MKDISNERRKRLAEALRQNLKRRKAQGRERGAAGDGLRQANDVRRPGGRQDD